MSLLCAVLPATSSAFLAALQHSSAAFSLLDGWLDYRCIPMLQRGAPEVHDPGTEVSDFILAPMLTAPMEGQMYTGIPLLKAILLLGVAEGRAEGSLMTILADGLYKARGPKVWRDLMPPARAPNISIRDALAHCDTHANTLLSLSGERNKLQTQWLEALRRWCALLQVRRALNRKPFVLTLVEDRRGDDDQAPSLPIVEIDRGTDAPRLNEAEREEIEPLPPSQTPEAPPSAPRAVPKVQDDPETLEGGEARRARTGFRGALENQFLPWVNSQLNPLDSDALMVAMRAALLPGQTTRDVVGLLAWSCVTGQLIEQAIEIGRTPLPDGSFLDGRTYMRYVAPQENAWEPSASQVAIMRPRATHVPLALPVEIAEWLDERMPAGGAVSLRAALGATPQSAVGAVREWLSEIRASTGGQQTLGRVQWWLPIALYRVLADHVPPHLLCAVNDAMPCPSAYYRSYEIGELGALHGRALTEAGWSMPPASTAEGKSIGWVGSQLNPEPRHVKALWEKVTCHFESLANDETLSLYKRHNAREIHEAFSQMFQTFHRAVSDPMESLEYIDIDGRRMLLDDKSQGEARAHRLIPLTNLATRQCEAQIDHVRRLSAAVAPQAPETAQRLMAMLEHPQWRAAPFRFLLNERLEIVRLKPQAMLQALQGLWDLPLNLARHFGSTWLLQRNSDVPSVSDMSLCSLLGHQDLGTLNLSPLSPLEFEPLFGVLSTRLDAFVSELGLRSILSFLPPLAADASLPRSRKRLGEMSFGHRHRELAREKQRASLRADAQQWIREQLGTRSEDKLSQDDVDALFERVRKATPNRRNYWASERFEAMRTAIVEIAARFEDVKLELPAIALAIRDVAHVCSMDGLAAARWLQDLRAAHAAATLESFRSWRSDKSSAYVMSASTAVLSLIVDSLVIDPAAWSAWHAGDRRLEVFMDEDDRAWIRMPLPTRNSRLYPVRRDLAERLAGISADAWQGFEFEAVADLVRSLLAPWYGARDAPDFWQLLNRIQSATAARMSGVTLGYADGSHGSVSPERMCIERRAGLPPTVEAVAVWEAARSSTAKSEVTLAAAGVASATGTGRLTQLVEFRRLMSQALRQLERMPGAGRTGKGAKAKAGTATAPDDEGQRRTKRDAGRDPGRFKRFLDVLDSNWTDLVSSPRLPPACGMAVKWVYRMAQDGKSGCDDYAPKTIRNYWYSWGLRFIEEFGPVDPRQVSPSECEEIYLQIVEEATLRVRQHLYAPMRSFHRHLVDKHGVVEIDWSQLRVATDQGLTHVDANLVHEHEYLQALELLRGDEGVPERVRGMQAAVLVLLYRFGLRIAECLGLRAKDVVFDVKEQRWIVRVRGNQYRSLKTDNARRTVVGLEPLSKLEVSVLEAWSAHVDTFLNGDDIRPFFSASATGAAACGTFPAADRCASRRAGVARGDGRSFHSCSPLPAHVCDAHSRRGLGALAWDRARGERRGRPEESG